MVKRKAKRRKRQVKPAPAPGKLVEPYWKDVQVRRGTPSGQVQG